jgi:hypothetical protein
MLNKISLRLVFLFVLLLGCSEIKDSFYINIDAARKDGAIERGWIPDFLPTSSYEIYERHDLDTNTVWLRFKFDKKDEKQLISLIKEVKFDEIDSIEFIAPDVKWWPKTVNKESTKNRQSGLKLYKRTSGYYDNQQKIVPGFFIIDWNSDTGYYWRYGY